MSHLQPVRGHYVVHVHDEGERCDLATGGCAYHPTWLTRLLTRLSLLRSTT